MELFSVEGTRLGAVELPQKIRAYIVLTKPRVVQLLLITTVPAMVLAQRGLPELWLVFATVLGGYLSAGCAGVFNCYIDRDIDKLMNRTKRRPLVTGEVSPKGALVFAWALGVLSVVILGFFTTWLAAALSVLAVLLYVVFYTLLLKRRTSQNIVWGGIAGCMPVLIGWSAVTGSLAWEAYILFGIIFLWTPAHYWPLSMKYREDYTRAGVPMLPVLQEDRSVVMRVMVYGVAMVLCSVVLIPVAQMSFFYITVAATCGFWFIYKTYLLYEQVRNEQKTAAPMKVFHASILYLTVLFLAVGLDPLIQNLS